MEAADIPDDLPHRDEVFPDPDEWINPGDAVVYRPFAGCHAGPMSKEKGLLYADLELSEVATSRRRFDAMGHYSRPDVFQLQVNRTPQAAVEFS